MSGDMSDHCGGIPPATAGIIPRTLARIFQVLEQAGDEYSVKCSFLELYNEEPRDLLSIQEDSKVKIFENKDSALHVKGLEEIAVTDAHHGIRVLQEGSRRREVAATKCNEVSSRSHSVFSITVHSKQTATNAGEDLLRVGKLNLVDLAGSENVGRSGAQNQRAREAGMINQSLLALGRVINALVERSQHVPYRESKLTRLLQDSLGGATKTCIIATLSPAKINMDETVSTLDYANRAKSIKNKPQVSQIMTKKTLINEYIQENERLKRDLNAARTKNGIFMTEESHKALVDENESNKVLTEEQQRAIDAGQQQMRALEEQLRNLSAANIAKDEKLQQLTKEMELTQHKLQDTENSLQHTEATLRATSQSLERETILRQAHQQKEGELNTIATELRSSLESAIRDNESLHAKTERKHRVEEVNRVSYRQVQKGLADSTNRLDLVVGSFAESQTNKAVITEKHITAFVIKQMKLFSDAMLYHDGQSNEFESRINTMASSLDGSQKEMLQALDEINGHRKNVKAKLDEVLLGLNGAVQQIAEEIATQLVTFRKDFYENFDNLASDVKHLFARAEKHAASQAAAISALQDDLQGALTQNTSLVQGAAQKFSQEHEASSLQSREQLAQLASAMNLLQNIAQGMHANNNARDGASAGLDKTLCTAVAGMADGHGKHSSIIETLKESEASYVKALAKQKDDTKKSMYRTCGFTQERIDAIKQNTDAIPKSTAEAVHVAHQHVDVQIDALEEQISNVKRTQESHHVTHQKGVSVLLANTRETRQSLQHAFGKAKPETQSHGKELLDNTADFKADLSTLASNTRQDIDAIREQLQVQLQRDVPTQTTPQKRKYVYPSTWETTKPHGELLAEHQTLDSEVRPATAMSTATEQQQQQGVERNPLCDVDVNVTSPMLQTAMAGQVEDELAVPMVIKSSIPALKSRGSSEKEVLKATTLGAGGQENGVRPYKSRKRALGA